jgi:hypothetical protein
MDADDDNIKARTPIAMWQFPQQRQPIHCPGFHRFGMRVMNAHLMGAHLEPAKEVDDFRVTPKDHRHLVDEGDIDVALRVLYRLRDLGSADVARDERATLGDATIEGRQPRRDCRRLAGDDLGGRSTVCYDRWQGAVHSAEDALQQCGAAVIRMDYGAAIDDIAKAQRERECPPDSWRHPSSSLWTGYLRSCLQFGVSHHPVLRPRSSSNGQRREARQL